MVAGTWNSGPKGTPCVRHEQPEGGRRRPSLLAMLAGLLCLILGAACGSGSGNPPPPVISSLTAAKATLTVGAATTLTAVFSEGTGALDHGLGEVQSGVAVSTGSLTSDTTFTLTVTGPGGTLTRQIQVRAVAAPAIASFSALKGTLTMGSATALVGDFTGGAGSVSGGLGSMASGVALTTGALTGTTTFTLTVINEAGDSTTAQTTVTVVAAPAIASFSPLKGTLTTGSATALIGVFTGGTGNVNGGLGPMAPGAALGTGPLAGTTTFTLTVTNEAGDSTTAQATVTVVAAPAIASFAPLKGTLTTGSATDLTGVFTGGAGSVSGGLGSMATGVALGTGALTESTTFTLTVTNDAGDSTTAQATVTVVAAPAIDGFTPLKAILTTGNATTLTGVFTGGTGSISGGLGSVATGVALSTGALTQTTLFTLTVTNEAGDSVTAQTTVTVVAPPAIATFTSSSPKVGPGQSVALTGEFSGGTGSIDHGLGPVLNGVGIPSGEVAATSLFTLTVTNAAGDAVSARVAVRSPNRLTTGLYHAAAVKPDGTVWVWGRNDQGQMGDGTAFNQGVPTPVPGLSGVAGVAAGARHLLALKADGTVWAWGEDYLGIPAGEFHSVPTQVAGLSGVVDVAGGAGFSLAVTSDGSVWAWGGNHYGEAGADAQSPQLAPVQIPGLSGVIAVAAGDYHALALKADGTVWAWGDNFYGQLGDGTQISRTTPLQVPGLGDVVALAGVNPSGSLALKSDGTVWAWGYNIPNKFGDGLAQAILVPARISALSDVISMAGGFGHGVFAKGDGSVWCGGDNSQSQCAVHEPQEGAIPLHAMAGLPGCVAVAAAWYHSLALGQDGTLWAWGDNEAGLLGDGAPQARMTPTVSPYGPWAQIRGAGIRTLALRADGTAWGWGRNLAAELGDGTSFNRSQPGMVQSPLKVTAISGRGQGSLILREDGSVWRLGMNPDPDHEFTPMDTLGDTVAIAAGEEHFLALEADGTVWAWGRSSEGELGDGTNTGSDTPVQVSGLTGVAQVAAANAISFALKSDGTVWTWGKSISFGSIRRNLTPVAVDGLPEVVALAPGSNHCLALGTDGSVWAWGYAAEGQLGDGTSQWEYPPVKVQGLGTIQAIACGDSHSLALDTDGNVWAWGRNAEGQLGDGTLTNRNVPYQVPGLTGITAISAGSHHSLAITPTQSFAWGYDDFSQLGLDRIGESGLPLQIPVFRVW